MAQRTCGFDGCEGVHLARGWCRKHYYRWYRTGDAAVVRPNNGPGNGPTHPLWKGGEATYTALHNRVYRARGKADHCEQCGASGPGQWYEWAQKHGTDGTDVYDYTSMCIPCHRTYDLGRITFEQRQEIRDRVAAGESHQDLAREFGISPSVIRHGLDPRTRKWISPL